MRYKALISGVFVSVFKLLIHELKNKGLQKRKGELQQTIKKIKLPNSPYFTIIFTIQLLDLSPLCRHS